MNINWRHLSGTHQEKVGIVLLQKLSFRRLSVHTNSKFAVVVPMLLESATLSVCSCWGLLQIQHRWQNSVISLLCNPFDESAPNCVKKWWWFDDDEEEESYHQSLHLLVHWPCETNFSSKSRMPFQSSMCKRAMKHVTISLYHSCQPANLFKLVDNHHWNATHSFPCCV